MPITLSRLQFGRTGSRQINVIIAAIEAALNGALPETFAIAAVTGLQAALDGKAAKTLPTYTVATLPAAADNLRVLLHCSDGNAGDPCVVFSDGANWKVIALGANAAAA